MRKVVVYIAMSLDGYVADKTGGVEFLQGDGSTAESMGSFEEFFNTASDVVMGYTTYHQVITELAPDSYPYAGKKSYVFTRKNPEDLDAKEDVFFINEDIKTFIQKLKENSDDGVIWINGGASIVNSVLKSRLADEIVVSVIPTILGGGTQLFQDTGDELKLKLVSTLSYNGITDLKYVMR